MMSLLEPLLALLPQGQMNQLGAALALAVAAFSVSHRFLRV